MTNFLKKENEYLGILLFDEQLKVGHMRGGDSAQEVVNVARQSIRGISPEETPKILKSLLNRFNARKPQVVCIVPPNVVTTKSIEIPSVDPQEIKSIINLQAGRHTPYSREEIIIDFVNLGVFQRNYTKVLLVIANRSAIKNQLHILEQAGLEAERIFFASEAITYFYLKALNLQEGHPPVAMIDVNGQYTDFTVIAQQRISACRSIPVGLAHLLTEGQAGKERLASELKNSLDAHQGEDAQNIPNAFFLTGDSALMKDLYTMLKETLQLNLKMMPYLDYVKTTSVAKKAILEVGDDSFLTVIAGVSACHQCRIDLLPEEVKLQRSLQTQGKEIVRSAVFAIIILILVCIWFFAKIYIKTSFLQKLKTNYNNSREEAEILARIAERTGIVKDFLNNRLVTLDIINELYRIVPNEIYLNNVIIEESGKITIQGTSESMSRVFTLVSALEESSLFKNVKTDSTAAKKERGKDLAAFELSFKLESAKDDAVETSKETKPNAKTQEEKTEKKEKE